MFWKLLTTIIIQCDLKKKVMEIERKVLLKLAEINDAEFIFEIRNNESLNKYLSKTGSNLENQINWLKKYKQREQENKEYYFIISDDIGNKYGTIRLYNFDFKDKSFEWGSWILSKNRPKGFSYLSIISSFDFAFNTLKMEKARIEVIKENEKAIYIYKKIGAKLYSKSNEKFYFNYLKNDFLKFKTYFLGEVNEKI